MSKHQCESHSFWILCFSLRTGFADFNSFSKTSGSFLKIICTFVIGIWGFILHLIFGISHSDQIQKTVRPLSEKKLEIHNRLLNHLLSRIRVTGPSFTRETDIIA